MNRAVYKHLLSTYGRSLGYWFGVIAEFVRSIFLRVWVAIIVSQLAANIATGEFLSAQNNVILFIAVYAAGSIIGVLGELVALRAEDDIYEELAVSYHQKLTSKDMSFYRDHQTGYLVSLFRQYLDSSLNIVRTARTEIVGTLVSLSAPTVVLTAIDWRLGALALAIVLIQLLYVVWASSKSNRYRAISHEVYRKITGEVSDQITNITAFKSSGLEKNLYTRVAKLIREETEAFWLRRKLGLLLDLPRDLLTAAGVAAAFWLVLSTSSAAASPVGLIVLVLTYMFQVMRSVGDLPNIILKHDDSVTKVFPTLAYLGDRFQTIADPKEPKRLEVKKGEILLDNISFKYGSENVRQKQIDVFKNLTIRFAGGEHVGIVGLSGAGKSTLASILMRFDEVTGGAIKIDGVDIRDVRQSELRQQIAYVPQEPLLFHRTIKDNIAYGQESITQEQVVSAAKAAHAHEFITQLPNGYDSLVGERGVKLSGGQKQRIVIARAVLKAAPIIIFDEATSALDTESEKIIQGALPDIIGKHTAIVIAHRLSTIAGLDRILVMEDGRIIEEGSHQQLIAQKGKYYSLWQKQLVS